MNRQFLISLLCISTPAWSLAPVDETLKGKCILPAVQAGSLIGRWKNTPVALVLERDRFTVDEVTAIIDAATKWNDFFLTAHGYKIFDFGTRESPNFSSAEKPDPICEARMVVPDSLQPESVTIYRKDAWPSHIPPMVLAVTSTCQRVTTPFNLFFWAKIEVNFAKFYGAKQAHPDLTTTMVHELGHLLGLDHSCEKCVAGVTKPAYMDAVMTPVVKIYTDGTSTIRRNLRANDRGRANCLYAKPTATP